MFLLKKASQKMALSGGRALRHTNKGRGGGLKAFDWLRCQPR